MMRAPLLACLVLLAPAAAQAQFTAAQPDDVGVVLLPFEYSSETDQSIAFLLEDYLRANLSRAIGHPVSVGADVVPAIPNGAEACLADFDCMQLLGGAFNASLVVRTEMSRSGGEISLACSWYATGNGVKIGKEFANFASGDERAMVEALKLHFRTYFDTSLRLSPENRAGEGGFMGRDDGSQDRVDEYRSGRQKRVSSRRQDFDAGRDEAFDRDDPAADLRSLVDDEPEAEPTPRRQEPRRAERRQDEAYDLPEEDADFDDLDDGDADADPMGGRDDRGSTGRSDRRGSERRSQPRRTEPQRVEPEPIEEDLEDDEEELLLDDTTTGASVTSYAEAQRMGYGPREYQRFVRTGLSIEAYQKQRWGLGKRFYIKLGGFYGLGYTTRRYASTVYIRVGGVKTDEYMWERLGFSALNPGFEIGAGVNPIDLLSIEAELAVMHAVQDLRREYDSDDIGSNVGQVTPVSRTMPVVAIDVRAKFFFPPRTRVKATAGVGPSFLIFNGYNFTDQDAQQLQYTSRPTTAVIGITPSVGMVASITPFLSLYADVRPTIYVAQGATNYQEHLLFNGATEERLPPESKQEPLAVIPLMGKVAVGAMIVF